MLFILSAILLDTANAQVSSENLFKAPFISTGNSQQSPQSIMQNSEKEIIFIENLGQIRDSKGNKIPDVLFLTRSQSVDMYITKSGLTYVFRKTEGDSKADNLKSSYYRLDMEFVGMNKNIKIKKEYAVNQKFNYFTPKYPNGISPRGYKKITIENVYDGIDLVYYEKEGKMKYDFIVKAGADVNKIKMKYEGASKVYLDKDGSVVVTTTMGEIREEKPFTYSIKTGKEKVCRYEVYGNSVQFDITKHNNNEDVIIDPYRIWATYYGGNSDDYGYSICTDNSGNIYITGNTKSYNFPTQTMTGAYTQTYGGGSNGDAYILKFNSNGVRLWATFYGGSSHDWGTGICTDNSGNLYVAGYTFSTNFPTQSLSGAYNQTYGGTGDAFILKFNNGGVRLWATYYGGSGYEWEPKICTDNLNNLYVLGTTGSGNLPVQTLSGAYNQATYGGGTNDAFVLRFNSSGVRLWATYYGGSGDDRSGYICADDSNNIYCTGITWGLWNWFPTQILAGAYNQDSGGIGGDAYILKFNSSGVRLWATCYGGSGEDFGYGICKDNSGNLYVTGKAQLNFPTQTLAGAYNQTTCAGGDDAFILKFNSNCARVWATYYGGTGTDNGKSICTSNSGNLYLTGQAYDGFPTQTLAGAYNQTTYGGAGSDAFILLFDNNCVRLWASYYGGSSGEGGESICTDNSDNLYVLGSTGSPNFPVLIQPGAYNQTSGGSGEAFILKFSPTPSGVKKITNEVPVKYSLHQNYPNPFNPTTNMRFDLHKLSHAKLIVFDMLGKEVAVLVDEKLSAGIYEVDWDGSDYPSGVYFYKLITDEFVDVKKMVLVK